MAIGLITNPTTPIAIGTVATNTWASDVEDNINGFIAGTASLKGMVLDGSGGLAVSAAAGALTANSLQMHIVTTQSGATTIAAGTGAGTAPTLTITGNDACGIVNLTTGTGPAGTHATIATITFATSYPFAQSVGVVMFPLGPNAAALSGATQVYAGVANSGGSTPWAAFQIISGSSALTAATQYIWQYIVIASA